MRLAIDIPSEIAVDFKNDRFDDFFARVLADMDDGLLCGRYEQEIAESLRAAFGEAKVIE